ncbi:hypothetical protein [Xenorhabdus sp. KK7.4]|uniref:hypothetical protein n=1 Tax=Xenorhabdus sp. KK7.4 TaxID=1851572 RepID=UPI00187C5096|nr:hypothetical protein [Xenorhabdus sp. KK7.4]
MNYRETLSFQYTCSQLNDSIEDHHNTLASDDLAFSTRSTLVFICSRSQMGIFQ